MNLITLDFETFYDKDYSLKKMTTEAYIRDERFQAIGVSIKEGAGDPVWYPGLEAECALEAIDWSNAMMLAHNNAFDGAILTWRYGHRPAFLLDTMSMARPKHGMTTGISLAKLAEHYGVGVKGTEVIQALGKRLEDFNDAELAQYGRYCENDNTLCYDLFKILRVGFPTSELKVIDMLLRMFTDPVLELDAEKLHVHLANVLAKKEALMEKVAVDRDLLMSDPKFAELLEARGVEPPTKYSVKKSATAGEDVYAYAFSKTDTEFTDLLEHEDEEVQALVAARLGIKSTIEQTRTERLIGIAGRGSFPIMLNYYGAHPGRCSGGDGVNPQNFSTTRGGGGQIRNAIEAPDGHVVVVGDSSQIEARLTAFVAGQDDLVEDFRNKVDIYSNFATDIYGYLVTKKDNETERHVGKTSILQLGFGAAHKKFRHTLASKEPRVFIGDEEARHVVSLYRTKYDKIPELWDRVGDMLDAIIGGAERYEVANGLLWADGEGIHLPNGMLIRYPGLEVEIIRKRREYTYYNRKKPTRLWGSKGTQNCIEGLARIVVFDQMLAMEKWMREEAMLVGHYRIALTVHDEMVCVVPRGDRDRVQEQMEIIMSTPPAWAPTLPVACDVGHGKTYGEAK